MHMAFQPLVWHWWTLFYFFFSLSTHLLCMAPHNFKQTLQFVLHSDLIHDLLIIFLFKMIYKFRIIFQFHPPLIHIFLFCLDNIWNWGFFMISSPFNFFLIWFDLYSFFSCNFFFSFGNFLNFFTISSFNIKLVRN